MSGIRGTQPFTGTPTPITCPCCGDRLFQVESGAYACEICGLRVPAPSRGTNGKAAALNREEEARDGDSRMREPIFPLRPRRRSTGLILAS